MMVCNDSRVLTRCLESVRDFIATFVILDAGSRDNTRSLLSDILAPMEGRILDVRPGTSEDPGAILYSHASEYSDYVLFMQPDEQYSSIYCPASRPDHDVHLVEIDFGRCSFVQPRFIRSGLRDPVPDPFRTGGTATGAFSIGTMEHVRLSKQWFRHADDRTFASDRGHDQPARRVGESVSPVDCVELAIHCTRRRDLEGALKWLSSGLGNCDDPEIEWELHYLLGLACLDGGDRARAFDEFVLAFELDPDRVESLHQLVRMKMAAGDLRSALELSRVSLSPEIPVAKGYFERTVYERERYTLHILLLERLGDFTQARDVCESLLQTPDLGISFRRFLEKSRARYDSVPNVMPTGSRTQAVAGGRPLLTIGMAVYDDYDGVYFSVMSILLYHRECLEYIDFVIIDNNPKGDSANSTRRFCEKLGLRYIPIEDYCATAVRDSLFRYATGRFVLCLDSHVMLLPGALSRLIAYIQNDRECGDLLQGPLVNDTGDRLFTHMEPRWKNGMLGAWKETEGISRDSPPFEIGMQGLGVFCCRKEAWPGLNPRFAGFGGEEGYLHEKFRRSGARVMCLPFLLWVHRFERPLGVPYRIDWQDRIRNYLIGHDELGWDVRELAIHFERVIGFDEMSTAYAGFLHERKSPFFKLDAIYFIDRDTFPKITAESSRRFDDLGVARRIRRIELGPGNDAADVRATVAGILASSKVHGYGKVLVVSSGELLPYDLADVLSMVFNELEGEPWSFCFLGLDTDVAPVSSSEPGKPCLVRIQDSGSRPGSLERLISSSGSFLVNLTSEVERLVDRPGPQNDPNPQAWPTNCATARELDDVPNCYAVHPPATVRRDRFNTVDDPTRYCFV